MDVPFLDLGPQYDEVRDEILAGIDLSCITSSFILGEEVEAFEREFAAYCGVNHCVALNSGTSSLHLALLAAGIESGDEVITSPNTFIATVEAISYTGATPVFVDIDPNTGNLDPSLIASAISEQTRAIIPVHLYGRPADMRSIMMLAQNRDLVVIEDACQAHGACCADQRVGSFGMAASFSFYPSKNLGAYGEGGALTTNNGEVAAFAREMRDHGQADRYHHARVGFNYRMDAFQGVVLRAKLKHLEVWNGARQLIAERYRELLQDSVLIPRDAHRMDCVYYVFAVLCEERDAVRAEMERRGVRTGVHYPVPVHLQPAYAHLGHENGAFPHAERWCETVLSLPIYPEMPFSHVEYVAEALLEAIGSRV